MRRRKTSEKDFQKQHGLFCAISIKRHRNNLALDVTASNPPYDYPNLKKKNRMFVNREPLPPPQGASSRHERGVELKRHRIIWSGAAPEPSPNTDNSVEGNRRRSFYLGPRTQAAGGLARIIGCTLTTPTITNCMFYSRSAEEFDVPEEDGILQEVCVR